MDSPTERSNRSGRNDKCLSMRKNTYCESFLYAVHIIEYDQCAVVLIQCPLEIKQYAAPHQWRR